MIVKGLVFDVNGTLVDIRTNEGREDVYRGLAAFLALRGLAVKPAELRDEYFAVIKEQRQAGGEEFPEFEAEAVWAMILRRRPSALAALARAEARQLPLFLARMYRALTLERLQLYAGVRPVLDELRSRFRLAVLSDGQSAWAREEMRAVGLDGYFRPVLISGDWGFRKPDPRLYARVLAGMRLKAGEVLFVGNDMYRDVYGAARAGMKTVFFASGQGQDRMDGVEPDYIIREFGQLLQAVEFFRSR